MMKKLFLLKNKDTTKKKITIIGIWIFSFAFPILFPTTVYNSLRKISTFNSNVYCYKSYLEYILFPLLLSMSIGLMFGSRLMRKATLFILYLSMILMLMNHIIKSMRLYTNDGCIGIFIGYGIDYDRLIYPEVILKWSATIVLIILFHMLFIYLLNNRESLKLYGLPQKIRIKENMLLSINAGILTIVFMLLPITTFLCESIKDTNTTTLNQVKIVKSPIIPPKKITRPSTPPYINHKHNLTYEIRFEENGTVKDLK